MYTFLSLCGSTKEKLCPRDRNWTLLKQQRFYFSPWRPTYRPHAPWPWPACWPILLVALITHAIQFNSICRCETRLPMKRAAITRSPLVPLALMAHAFFIRAPIPFNLCTIDRRRRRILFTCGVEYPSVVDELFTDYTYMYVDRMVMECFGDASNLRHKCKDDNSRSPCSQTKYENAPSLNDATGGLLFRNTSHKSRSRIIPSMNASQEEETKQLPTRLPRSSL